MKKKCDACYGFGYWPFGRSAPLGELDARDLGMSKPCPKCGKFFGEKVD